MQPGPRKLNGTHCRHMNIRAPPSSDASCSTADPPRDILNYPCCAARRAVSCVSIALRGVVSRVGSGRPMPIGNFLRVCEASLFRFLALLRRPARAMSS